MNCEGHVNGERRRERAAHVPMPLMRAVVLATTHDDIEAQKVCDWQHPLAVQRAIHGEAASTYASGGGSAKLLVGAPSARPSPARAGAEPVSLVARREAGTDAATLKAEGKACKELRAVGYDWRELIEAGFAKAPLMNAGFNVTRLGVTGCDELGISGQQLREVGTLSCCCCFHDLSLTFHGRP